MTTPTVVLAGGGSGGHISPGLAIAEALQDVANDLASHFACSTRPIDAHMLRTADRTWTALPAAPPTIRPIGAWKFASGFVRSTSRAQEMFKEHHVRAVVLLGGYVSVPVAHAARKRGIPTILLNLDCVPGRANRWLQPRADTVLSAVPTITPMAETTTGMPIRRQAQPPAPPDQCRRMLGLDPDRPTLVITGASQGATTINQLASDIARHKRSMLQGWQVIHITGQHMVDDMTHQWADSGIPAVVESFRNEMGMVWGAADLVISRAGACSVAEITFAGVPAIYLPYPHHRDQHQRHNATAAVEAGAAALVEDQVEPARTLPELLQVLEPLLRDAALLQPLQKAAQDRCGGDAAHAVASQVINCLK